MSEMVLSVKTLSEALFELIPTEKVKIRQSNGVISLIPLRDAAKNECPLLGLTAGSSLTVDKFLAMTQEDKLLEGVS